MGDAKKLTKEGWMEWLEDKAGPEMIYIVVVGLASNSEKLIDSVLEYVNEK